MTSLARIGDSLRGWLFCEYLPLSYQSHKVLTVGVACLLVPRPTSSSAPGSTTTATELEVGTSSLMVTPSAISRTFSRIGLGECSTRYREAEAVGATVQFDF